jgi:hypothetical protein
MNREIRAVGRPDYPAAIYVAHAGWAEERWTLGLLYAFYRSPGRAAVSDLELPGLPPTRMALPAGQSALPDVDVHYYGLRFEQDLSPISYRFSAYYNSGRDIAVDASGTRVGATRRSIRGALGYLEVVYHFGAGHNGAGCLETMPARNSCVRAAAIVDGPELALAGLFSTRDNDDGDDRLRGFGALRPLPAVLGGAASILLSGPPPGRERPALRNSQPGATFADSGLPASQSRYSEGSVFERARDNVDPTPPEYDNEGQTMGSLRLSFVPLEHLEFDLFANYANFRGGDGWEGIVAARLPFQFVDIDFAVQASVTSATYRPFESERNAYTGLLQRPARRFYNRYVLGFVLAL